MTHSLYLTFPNKSPLSVQVQLTAAGLLVQGIDRPDVSFVLTGVSGVQFAAAAAPVSARPDVLAMTPADVVRYFEQSPVLCIYADDVRTAILGRADGPQSDFQLSQDINAVRGLINPSQADIAERLFGDRTKTGGSYRRRILAVLGATTTGSSGQTEDFIKSRAA